MKALLDRLAFARFALVHRRSLAAQERWQGARLRSLVAHAAQRVPLYRELLAAAGVRPEDVRSLVDIVRLPLMKKAHYLGRMHEELIDSGRILRSFWHVTSGTSGEPLRFFMSDKAVLKSYVDLASLRFLWWRGERFSSLFTVRVAQVRLRGPNDHRRFFIPVSDYLADPPRSLARVAGFAPDILQSYPSLLLDMTRLAEQGDIELPRPRFVLSFGEKLGHAACERIEHAFRAEVYDRYGLEEIGVVGVECGRHDGFHINTESVIVEVLGADGEPLKDGVVGRVVATDLLNYNMPFIRYETGDTGRTSREPCACGLRSPRLWVDGRHTACLEFPHRRVHHLEFDGAMDGFMNEVLQYQIAKTAERSVVARVIPGPAWSAETKERIIERLFALTRAHVSVEERRALPITPRGKCRIVVDESSGK